MRLSIEFREVRFGAPAPDASPKLASYVLHLNIVEDTGAQTDIAESSGYLDPSVQQPGDVRSCAIVKRGQEWPDR